MNRSALVTLRPASISDRQCVYEWMAQSDLTQWMMGPPIFPDAPIPTWAQFCDDYTELFFDGSRPDFGRSFIIEVDGEPVGHVSYSEVDMGKGQAELDIWLKCEGVCGHGYGSEALALLIRHLGETMGLTEFIMRPSQRNPRAIRAYEKAGFALLAITPEEQNAIYGSTEYGDTVVMHQKIIPSIPN
jgi:diamine N-acetyltransferase